MVGNDVNWNNYLHFSNPDIHCVLALFTHGMKNGTTDLKFKLIIPPPVCSNVVPMVGRPTAFVFDGDNSILIRARFLPKHPYHSTTSVTEQIRTGNRLGKTDILYMYTHIDI